MKTQKPLPARNSEKSTLRSQARELAISIKTLNREVRALQAQYAEAPLFSFSKRMKTEIADDIVRLEARKADYTRQLNQLNSRLRATRKSSRPASPRTPPGRPCERDGWAKVELQNEIDQLYKDIGALGDRIGSMSRSPERSQLVLKHKNMIRQRRQLIWQINRT